jgi:hypothetical protein
MKNVYLALSFKLTKAYIKFALNESEDGANQETPAFKGK